MIPQQINCRSDTKSGITQKKLKVQVAVDDGMVNPIIEAISGAAKTDEIGDGNMFVFDLGQVVRSRTGDTGPDVL